MIRLLTIAFTTLFLLLTSCSTVVTPNASLINKGLLPLSSSNAYLGSNLFLSREMEASPVMYNFIKSRGGPAAIELIHGSFGTLNMTMYYPRSNEVFVAETEQRGENLFEWVIAGPYRLNRHQYRLLEPLISKDFDSPLFVINGKETRFHQIRPLRKPTLPIAVPPPTPSPTPTPKPKVFRKKPNGAEADKHESKVDPKNTIPLNTDQQAIAMSQGFAERTPSGDVVHTVASEEETLEQIVKWYTGGTKSLDTVASTNSLSKPYAVKVGDRIKIPLFMVHQFKRMH